MLEDLGPISFIEIGPSTVEPQHIMDSMFANVIRINDDGVDLAHSRYGVNEVASALIER